MIGDTGEIREIPSGMLTRSETSVLAHFECVKGIKKRKVKKVKYRGIGLSGGDSGGRRESRRGGQKNLRLQFVLTGKSGPNSPFPVIRASANQRRDDSAQRAHPGPDAGVIFWIMDEKMRSPGTVTSSYQPKLE